jgi:predicted DNA-binding transcriptional regulator AlpA
MSDGITTSKIQRLAASPQSSKELALPTDRLWDVHQAAAFLKRSVSWVYKAAERGELPRARGFGWGLRFVPAELYAYVKGIEAPAASGLPISRRNGGS